MKRGKRDLANEPGCEVSRHCLHHFSFIYMLILDLVVRRDQRNQKKAYREDLGRRARPTQSKKCSPRRRLRSFWLEACHKAWQPWGADCAQKRARF